MTHSFYVTGGTLGLDTPSYIPRDADEELYRALSAGEFCYVLTSRQMGKSSLMVRTASRLRADNSRVAVMDLTAIGINLTVEQWYDGLLSRLGAQLHLEAELEERAASRPQLGPLQRWLFAVESIVQDRVPGKIFVFIDEIDLVRSLKFSTDEFFAALRQCFNRRTDDEQWGRITFCLLGVATPSDLISDPHMTPFNIGRRIELNDFRRDEVAKLANGLGKQDEMAQRLLTRVLDWTGGHPYLTQRLCGAIASAGNVGHVRQVDQVCESVFLSPGAREQDDNLIFVRERLLRGEVDLATLLDLYLRICRRNVVEDGNDPRIETLKLSGIVRSRSGRLVISNRIYGRVFDSTWVGAHMPNAELHRQRAAFYQGLARAASVASVIVLILGAALATAYLEWQKAEVTLQVAAVSETAARQQHHRALGAAAEAEAALGRETIQRKLAELREQEAKDLRELAETRRKTAEENYLTAVENYRRMQLAFRSLSEERRSVEERGKLFLAIPQWLQSYSATAVADHAKRHVEQGRRTDALKTYAEFCDLALADEDGFWARELVRIDPERLRSLDLDGSVLETRISVEPREIQQKVLEPGIALGEQQHSAEPNEECDSLLATLYDCQARLVFQYPELSGAKEGRMARIVGIYDRAIRLDDSRSKFYVGRAVARFLNGQDQLDLVEFDLRSALAQFPLRVQPPSGDEVVTPAHHELSMILNSLGNVLELQAEATLPERKKLLDAAVDLHSQANKLQPKNARYLVSLARTHRKQFASTDPTPSPALLQQSLNWLEIAKQLDDQYAQLYNELGETRLLLGDIEGARKQFDLAVHFGNLRDSAPNRYRYYCNQSNAYWRTPTTAANLTTALDAAKRAAELQSDDNVDALYYQGLALWSLALTSGGAPNKTPPLAQALQAFDSALQKNSNHVGAVLARCQMLFERKDETLAPDRLQELLGEADRALQVTTSPPDRAKAYYVIGLGRLRRHLDSRQEEPLVDALQSMLSATQTSLQYVALVTPYFRFAAERTWRDRALQARANNLQRAFLEKNPMHEIRNNSE